MSAARSDACAADAVPAAGAAVEPLHPLLQLQARDRADRGMLESAASIIRCSMTTR
jgi:hypothetical protein